MTPEDRKRFATWIAYISDYRLVKTSKGLKAVGTGIDDLSEAELATVRMTPCKYWRAARASRI